MRWRAFSLPNILAVCWLAGDAVSYGGIEIDVSAGHEMGDIRVGRQLQHAVAPLELFLAFGPEAEIDYGVFSKVKKSTPLEGNAMMETADAASASGVVNLHIAFAGDAIPLTAFHAGRGLGPPFKRVNP